MGHPNEHRLSPSSSTSSFDDDEIHRDNEGDEDYAPTTPSPPRRAAAAQGHILRDDDDDDSDDDEHRSRRRRRRMIVGGSPPQVRRPSSSPNACGGCGPGCFLFIAVVASLILYVVHLRNNPGPAPAGGASSSSSSSSGSGGGGGNSAGSSVAQILTQKSLSTLLPRSGESALDAGDLVECYVLTRKAKLRSVRIGSGNSGSGGGTTESGGGGGAREAASGGNSTSSSTTVPPPPSPPPPPNVVHVRKAALAFRYVPPRGSTAFGAIDPSKDGIGDGGGPPRAKKPFELTLEYGPQRTGSTQSSESIPVVHTASTEMLSGDEDERDDAFVTWENEGTVYYTTSIHRASTSSYTGGAGGGDDDNIGGGTMGAGGSSGSTSTTATEEWDGAYYLSPITGTVLRRILEKAAAYPIHRPRYQPFEVRSAPPRNDLILKSSGSDDFVWSMLDELAKLYVSVDPVLIPPKHSLVFYVGGRGDVKKMSGVETTVEDDPVPPKAGATASSEEGGGGDEGGGDGGGGSRSASGRRRSVSHRAAEFYERFYKCGDAIRTGDYGAFEPPTARPSPAPTMAPTGTRSPTDVPSGEASTVAPTVAPTLTQQKEEDGEEKTEGGEEGGDDKKEEELSAESTSKSSSGGGGGDAETKQSGGGGGDRSEGKGAELSVHGGVWEDKNGDGMQDPDEKLIRNVMVSLHDCDDDALIDTSYTHSGKDSFGEYAFDDLEPGNYYVEFEAPKNFVFSPSNQDGDESLDSDASGDTGKTTCARLEPGGEGVTWNAGVYNPPAIGRLVWEDKNGNGIHDAGEEGMENIKVELYDCRDDNLIDTLHTNSDGTYTFDGLKPGKYYLQFSAPDGFVFSPTKQGSNNEKDSDADEATGKTACTDLQSGDRDFTWGAGMYYSQSIGKNDETSQGPDADKGETEEGGTENDGDGRRLHRQDNRQDARRRRQSQRRYRRQAQGEGLDVLPEGDGSDGIVLDSSSHPEDDTSVKNESGGDDDYFGATPVGEGGADAASGEKGGDPNDEKGDATPDDAGSDEEGGTNEGDGDDNNNDQGDSPSDEGGTDDNNEEDAAVPPTEPASPAEAAQAAADAAQKAAEAADSANDPAAADAASAAAAAAQKAADATSSAAARAASEGLASGDGTVVTSVLSSCFSDPRYGIRRDVVVPVAPSGGDGGEDGNGEGSATGEEGGTDATATTTVTTTYAYIYLDGANYYRLNLTAPYWGTASVVRPVPRPETLPEGRGDLVDWSLFILILGGAVFGLLVLLQHMGLVNVSPKLRFKWFFDPHHHGGPPGENGGGSGGYVQAGMHSWDEQDDIDVEAHRRRRGGGHPHAFANPNAIPSSMGGRRRGVAMGIADEKKDGGRGGEGRRRRSRRPPPPPNPPDLLDHHDGDSVGLRGDEDTVGVGNGVEMVPKSSRHSSLTDAEYGIVDAGPSSSETNEFVGGEAVDPIGAMKTALSGDDDRGTNGGSGGAAGRGGKGHRRKGNGSASAASPHRRQSSRPDDIVPLPASLRMARDPDLVDLPSLKSTSKVAVPVSVLSPDSSRHNSEAGSAASSSRASVSEHSTQQHIV